MIISLPSYGSFDNLINRGLIKLHCTGEDTPLTSQVIFPKIHSTKYHALLSLELKTPFLAISSFRGYEHQRLVIKGLIMLKGTGYVIPRWGFRGNSPGIPVLAAKILISAVPWIFSDFDHNILVIGISHHRQNHWKVLLATKVKWCWSLWLLHTYVLTIDRTHAFGELGHSLTASCQPATKPSELDWALQRATCTARSEGSSHFQRL